MSWFDDNGYSPESDMPGADNAQIVPTAAPPGAPPVNPYAGTDTYVNPAMQGQGAGLGALYQQYYGTSAPPVADYDKNLGNPGGLAAIEAMMKADPNSLVNRAAAAPPGAQQKTAPGVPPSGPLVAPGLMNLLGNSPLMYPWDTPMPAAMTTPFDPGPQFQAPTTADLQDPNNPVGRGYQFTLQQGIDALQKSAAAKGTLLTGGMLKGLSEFTTGLADSTYQQQYNNAYQTWAGNLGSKYQAWAGNQTQAAQNYDTTYNMFRGNQTQPFNMLMALSGAGQVAAQNLNTAGAGVGANGANTLTGIGNAQAAGQVGGANAIAGNLGNLGNSAMLYGLMTGSSYKPSGAGGSFGAPSPTNPYADFA